MSHDERPVLITIGMYLSGSAGAMLLVVIAAAAANVGNFMIDGEAVAASEFLSRFGVLLAAEASILLAITGAIATGKVWSRHLMLLFWPITGAWAIGQVIRHVREGEPFHIDLTWLVAFAIAWWYLFGSQAAKRYYRRLETSGQSG